MKPLARWGFVIVVGCGSGGSKPAPSGEGTASGSSTAVSVEDPARDSRRLGGLDIPYAFIPKTLGALPTILPLQPGAPYRLSDFPDPLPNVGHQLEAGYAEGDAALAGVIVGYDQLSKVDLLPDLAKAWGAPTADPHPSPGLTSACWPETNHVTTCWQRFGDQRQWHLRFTSSTVAAPAAAPPDAPSSTTFTDEPLGKGACGWLGVKEASELLGVQVAYTERGPDLCRYGKGALELTVMESPAADANHANPVVGFADQANWDFVDALTFVTHGKGYRVAVFDPGRTSPQLRAVTLPIAKRVLAHLTK